MELQIGHLEVLLVAALVAILAARLRVPYVVGLVVAGIALSFFHLEPELDLTKELVFTALLPPLVFEAALYVRWRQLRRVLPVVLQYGGKLVIESTTGTDTTVRMSVRCATCQPKP